jgi:hypothetical protein
MNARWIGSRSSWAGIGLVCLAASGCLRELTVAKQESVSFSDADALDIFARMGSVLSAVDAPGDFACAADLQPELANLAAMTPEQQRQVEQEVARRGGSLAGGAQPLVFMLDGPVQSFEGPRVVMTAADFRTVTGKPAFIKVVGALHRCGNVMSMTSILGCTPLNGRNGVVVIDIGGDQMSRPVPSSQVWAHEYGHSVGLPDLRNQPTRVMNGFLDPRARTLTREECLTYTRVVDANGPNGSLRAAETTAPAEVAGPDELLDPIGGPGSTRRSPDVPVETFVRQTHYHGLGYALVDDFGPGDVAPLLRMLADPADVAHRDKTLALLGLIGDAEVGDALIEHVEAMRQQPMAWRQSGELTSALLGLGALANHNRSAAVVDQLQRWADPAGWSAESAELGRHIQVTALMALAMSGMPEGRDAIAAAAGNNRNPALDENLAEIAAMAETVAARGLGAYMNGEAR